ncbi:hypothetical protein ACIHFE_32245 [Streptomyces sp. NPDC052396]|uniref:hypothetical protein n=1 Tax=Streptomyces sp. NPDC052396 TaxID=3365689 RepID=UPI0037D368EF
MCACGPNACWFRGSSSRTTIPAATVVNEPVALGGTTEDSVRTGVEWLRPDELARRRRCHPGERYV